MAKGTRTGLSSSSFQEKTESWVAFLQAVLRTGSLAHRKAIAAKPEDFSSFPGPT